MTLIDTRTPDPKRLIPGATGDWEVIIGHGGPCPGARRNRSCFPALRPSFGAAPNANVSLVDAAMPGMLPVINEECVRAGDPHRPRAQGADQPQVGLRPEELLLSGPAAGLPDLAVQAADRRRGQGHRLGRPGQQGQFRGHRDRHRAAASGAGRRQVAARPASDHVLCRSQPLRRGADGDRLQARPALGRRGQGLSDQAAHDPALSRHLRRQHGRGLDARRRQRVGAQARRRRSARAARSRTSTRSASSARRSSTRRAARSTSSRTAARSTRRRGCSIRARARRARCAPRKRRMTTAISPIPTCCRSNSTRPMSTALAAHLPELPDDKKARLVSSARPVGL